MEHTLDPLDLIIEDRRYLGSGADVVMTIKSPAVIARSKVIFNRNIEFLSEAEQLCKTKNGQWFLYSFSCAEPMPSNLAVKPICAEEARVILSPNQELYVEHFGEPALA